MDDLIRRLPKTEVHLHLEGTISPKTLWELAHANNVALPVGTLPELEAMYSFESFDAFIKLWLLMCSCLRTPDDYVRMVDGFVSEARRQNVLYAELHFTPYNHEMLGFGGRRALDIVTRRLMESEASGGPVVRLITDISGEAKGTAAEYTVRLLEEEANPLVVALGLGGPEVGIPRSMFAPWFDRARAAGYWTVAHAGETGGADHVRQAVVELGARRVEHGIRAVEDPAVVSLLAERRVCCDVAITSNVCLKVYPSHEAHPIRALVRAGVPVTLSTDDPPFFSTDLLAEWQHALDLGFSMEEIWQMNLNGLRFGLADTAVRRKLLLTLEEEARRIAPQLAAPAP
ncbi:MAG TPA: adenosine deaminase, partial [Spirochaetia bacterium]